MDAARASVLPLRPLTIGELLDASVGVLRRCGAPLLALGLVLAIVQQSVSGLAQHSIPALQISPVAHGWDSWPQWWIWLACRLGGESAIIAVLAAPASAAAAADVVAARPRLGPAGRLWWLAAPGRRWWGVLAVAAVAGCLATVSVVLCGLPWLVVYGVTGLVVPVLIIDRAPAGKVAGRALRLVFIGACRPAAIRLLGYLGWLLVRLAVGLAGEQLVGRLGLPPVLLPMAAAVPWVLVGAVAFPALACLDACVHLENRMRTEGLDLALRRGDRRAVLEAV